MITEEVLATAERRNVCESDNDARRQAADSTQCREQQTVLAAISLTRSRDFTCGRKTDVETFGRNVVGHEPSQVVRQRESFRLSRRSFLRKLDEFGISRVNHKVRAEILRKILSRKIFSSDFAFYKVVLTRYL